MHDEMTRTPVALNALDMTRQTRHARLLAWALLGMFAAVTLALFVVPWQQSVPGSGRVIAYAPVERQQTIEAPIGGRVSRWHVQEGQRVSTGDAIADISDNDPMILQRLERQREAAQSAIEAADLAIMLAEARVTSLTSARAASVASADLKAMMARDKKDAAQEDLAAAQAEAETADLQRERLELLQADGLESQRALELARMKSRTAKAKVKAAKAKLKAAKRGVASLKLDRDEKGAKGDAGVDGAGGSVQSAREKKAKAQQELAKVEVKLARQQSMQIVAPRDGVIMRVTGGQGNEIVKAGDSLAVLVPDTESRAVELWVDGNNVPLITPGRHVRIQFEGWPAVQFVGWPSVAVGTFGGVVAFVDAADDGKGKFRVVVVPEDPEEWPEGRFLRQGVRANGWVMLDRVKLGYELWRQLNGFPPALDRPAELGSHHHLPGEKK